jgi:hypothetical protein
MFFTVFGYNSPRIESVSLDGSNRRVVINDKIVYPVGLTLDLANQFIYWIDTYLDVIERAAYDGSRRKTVKKGRLVSVEAGDPGRRHFQNLTDCFSLKVRDLFGIALFENDLYLTNWRNESVYRVNKFTGDTVMAVKSNKSRPYAIHTYHRQRQPESKKIAAAWISVLILSRLIWYIFVV